MKDKIILFANTDWYLWNYRLTLAKVLQTRGYEVVLVSPPGEYAPRLKQAGFRWVEFPLSRAGINPILELAAIFRLTRLLAGERPQILHLFTIKPVLYGSLAGRLVGVKRIINSIPGLGYIFTSTKKSVLQLRWFVRWLYRLALRGTLVIFQNDDDRAIFLRERLLGPEQTFVIYGSGVDLQQYRYEPEQNNEPLVILPARMIWEKGIAEFVEAAGILKKNGVRARFALMGMVDQGNPSSIPKAQLEQWAKSGRVEWWGWQENIPEVLRAAHVVCLPSYYREGIPRSLIEAAACGRAIVATDIPGIRQIVHEGENGLIVPSRNSEALAEAIKTLLDDPELRRQFGKRGREIVEKQFSIQNVLEQTLQLYEI